METTNLNPPHDHWTYTTAAMNQGNAAMNQYPGIPLVIKQEAETEETRTSNRAQRKRERMKREFIRAAQIAGCATAVLAGLFSLGYWLLIAASLPEKGAALLCLSFFCVYSIAIAPTIVGWFDED